ncbi:hypothetical protein EA796_00925 [Pseudomonas sp. AOB-7]|uniref:hypothetical protein n=1 Tax=Pseudomonas sp. AOB-7 TaxID=2482750 RepID=UPI000EFCF099|nr:hypothetical protein [Pseudomonas sp. AOB-7]RMH86425.1 hypothetical protein EA796_00925 [Pseudomonas sp. AOB-7]
MSKTAAPADAGTKPAANVQVKITREGGHRHAGDLHAKDAVIRVTERDAQIIVDRMKAGERVKGE